MKTSGKHVLGYGGGGGVDGKKMVFISGFEYCLLISYTVYVNVKVSKGCEDVSPNVWLTLLLKTRLLNRRDKGVEYDTFLCKWGNDANSYLSTVALDYEQSLWRTIETCVDFGRADEL
jgi:hypothetical protein